MPQQLTINSRFPYTGTASVVSDDPSEASKLVKSCSQPCPPGDFVKAAIGRAADRIGLPYSRVRDIWYRDARRIDAWEMDRIRSAALKAELDVALVGLAVARCCLQTLSSPVAREAVAALDRASFVLGGGSDASRRRISDKGGSL